MRTSPLKPDARLSNASHAVTTTGGAIALPTATVCGCVVKVRWFASAGFTVTVGCCVIVTEPTVAVIVFVPATVPRVQVVTAAIPSAPVVMGVVGSTVPVFTTTANVTATPGTALSN